VRDIRRPERSDLLLVGELDDVVIVLPDGAPGQGNELAVQIDGGALVGGLCILELVSRPSVTSVKDPTRVAVESAL
jgi:hypothetical protein